MCNLCESVSLCGVTNWDAKRGKEMDSWQCREMIIFYTRIQCSHIICEDKFDKLINLFFAVQSFCHSNFSSCWGISISQHHNPPIRLYLYTIASYFWEQGQEIERRISLEEWKVLLEQMLGFCFLRPAPLDPWSQGQTLICMCFNKFSFSYLCCAAPAKVWGLQ